MAKKAVVKLGWNRSPSSDVVKQEIALVVNGVSQTAIKVDAAVESYTLNIEASSTVTFSVVTYDSEDNKVTSESHTFTIGDLEAPLPATGLFHEIVGVVDDSAEPVDPTAPVSNLELAS